MQNTSPHTLATEVYEALAAFRGSDTIDTARALLRVLNRREKDIRDGILSDAEINVLLDQCIAVYNRNQNLADALI